MTLENTISFIFGALAINVNTPVLDSLITNHPIQTPLENMFSSGDLHEVIICGIKVLFGGFISVGINKFFHTAPKPKPTTTN